MMLLEKEIPTINGHVVTIDYPKMSSCFKCAWKRRFWRSFSATIKAFVGSDEYEAFASETQEEIVDVGF